MTDFVLELSKLLTVLQHGENPLTAENLKWLVLYGIVTIVFVDAVEKILKTGLKAISKYIRYDIIKPRFQWLDKKWRNSNAREWWVSFVQMPARKIRYCYVGRPIRWFKRKAKEIDNYKK